MSPTARSLARLREQGYLAEVVERFVPDARVRRDLFGVFDILAIKAEETLGVQVCTVTNQAKRLAKIEGEPRTGDWLLGGTRRIEVHGWALRGPRGKRKTWDVTVTEIT